MDLQIFYHFLPNEEVAGCKQFGNGHINSTFLLMTMKNEYYVIQKINTYVFKNVDHLMHNIVTVTEHLKNKNIESIEMMKSVDGKYYYEHEGEFYRMYRFQKDTFTYESPDGMKTVEYAATAFGKFHNYLADLDAAKIVEIIPHFHDTPHRFQDLQVASFKNIAGRVNNCQRELQLVNQYVEYYSLITDGIKSGEVKLHITHNDPKINNALFDSNTKAYRSIIDLDTVMPGSVLNDFGDALRSLFTGDKEDSKDYKSVVGKPEIYRHYLKAYYKETKNILTKREIELLPYAPFILTMELVMRFLEDYLNGDPYFKQKYEGHNLDRARTQLNLGLSLIENIEIYRQITNEIVGK